MSYRELLHSLGAATERKVLAAHAALTAGTIRTEGEFISIVASIIAKANGSAVALADLSLAATLTLQLREPVPPLGLLPPASDPDRLAKGLGTILSTDRLDTAMQLGRLANSEPRTQAAASYSEGMAKSSHVEGWTRGLSAAACQLCRWWARDGRVWPKDHPLKTHKGCSCTASPVTTERIRPVQR